MGSVVKQVLQFAISVGLARLLNPEDFGLMGMVVVFTGVATLFADLGLGSALVQKSDLDEAHLSSVYWLNLAVGLLITIVFIAAAPLIASFYNEPQLVPIVRVLSLLFVVSAFAIVQKNLLTREMRFRALATVDFIAIFLAGIVAIVLALYDFGVWSLVGQLLSVSIFSTVMLWMLSDWRPRFLFQRQAVKELWPFSSNLLGAQLLNYFVRTTDYLLIGRFLGSEDLGIYTRAYTTMLLPVNQVNHVVGRVMFPALSKIQEDTEQVKRIYLRANRSIGLLTIPLMAGLIVVAEPFVMALYGPKWEAVIPILQILCLEGLKQPLGATTGWIFQSQGRTDLMLRWNLLSVAVTVLAFLIGVQWGIIGVAVAYAIRSYLLWYPAITIPGHIIGLTFKEFVKNVAGIFGCAAIMALLVFGLGIILPDDWPYWLLLTIQVAFGALIYLLLIHFLRLKAYQETKELLLEQWQKRHALSG